MRSYGLTDEGRVRSSNQDYVFVSESPVGKLPNLFIVADGMGGHNAGDRASCLAVETLYNSAKKSKDRRPIKILARGIEKANTAVFEEASASPSFKGMGTTLVAAVIAKETMYIANVGDSRLYLIHNDGISQITRDHSLVEEMIRMGEITREEAKNHPDKNIITRAIGARNNVNTEFFETRITNDDVVLLCTDGLTNMVSDDEIFRIVKSEKSIHKAAERLIRTANANGGRDNITVLLITKRNNEVT